jgi:[protein-PII] uridylyltransferase
MSELPLLRPPSSVIPAVTDIFEPVSDALQKLMGDTPPGITLIGAMKNVWATVRNDAVRTNRKEGGRAAGQTLTLGADRIVELLLSWSTHRADGPGWKNIAVLALGSYGRRELAPYSDIDLMILYDESLPDVVLEPAVGNFLRPLWDCGWQVGHSVRTPQECLRTMADTSGGANTIETATAVMEARYVAGDRAFAESFLRETLPSFFRKYGRAFVESKFEETLSRWRGQSVYRTQPNLKESPGALRDFQLAIWIDQASRLSGHLPRLTNHPLVSDEAIARAREGYERILTFRVALHSLCRRKQDVLDYPMQEAVAQELGFVGSDELKPAEQLLRDYFQAATAVHRLAGTVTRRYQEERAVATRNIEKLRRRPVDADFTRIGDYLYSSSTEALKGPGWVEAAMRGMLHCARLGITLGQDVSELIRSRLPEMTPEMQKDPAVAAQFMLLMRERSNVAFALRLMRDTGLLGAYMPEFAQIEGLVINDTFHDYPVDEHTLHVVHGIDRLYESVESYDQFRRRLLETLPRPYLLRLACLFHDLGKSRGAPGHSQRGALMVPLIGERTGLTASEMRTLIFLVEEHLTLSKVSQRRDPNEGGILKALAAKIGTKEHLDLLFLLTYSDSQAVGKGSYPLWKDALLTELYTSLLGLLETDKSSGGTSVIARQVAQPGAGGAVERLQSVEPATLDERLLAWAPDEAMRAFAQKHLALVPRRYLSEVSLEEAISHLEALRRLETGNQEAVAAVSGSGGLVDMWVVCVDRPKRFSQICGAFLGTGVSVISAIAYTRTDGVILDHFRIAPSVDNESPDDTFWAKIASTVVETLAGRIDFRKQIEAVRKRFVRAPQITRQLEPELRVDNSISDHHTVVDVICGDRVGLLYGLTRALADLSCEIHFAKISTNQGLVTDVFYVSELNGEKVTDPEKMLNIRRLLKAVASDFQGAAR